MREDVNMDEPLPDIIYSGVSWSPTIHDGFGAHEDMTLSHLVQVLAALTGERLGAIVCVLSDERKQALAAALDWPDEREEYERSRKRLYAQAMEEKARADRAEQRVRELEGVLGITRTNRLSPTAEELRLWSEGLKIHALRSYRERNSLDLVAAKNVFESCAAALAKR
jgi:hypothetical protein